jgi:hypothetical protein
MRYLVSVIDDLSASGTPEEMAAIDAFNDRLREDGHWVFAGGLAAPGTAVVIDNRDGARTVTNGPFLRSEEHYSGFWIMETPDHETAQALAAEGSRACNRKVELRPFL